MNEIQSTFELLIQNGYRHWSKKSFKERILADGFIRNITNYNDEYVFSPDTIAIYNFVDDPILGQYKTAILDQRYGIVLSHKSSKSVLHKYTTHVLISGLSLQKSIAHTLKLTAFHSISLVHVIFFSLQTYTKHNTDWVGLHFFEDYNTEDDNITFTSINQKYSLSFKNTNPNIHKHISDSLQHNDFISSITHEYHISISWPCPLNSHKTGSMIFNTDFFQPLESIIKADLKDIIDQIVDDWHYLYISHIARERDMCFFDTCRLIYIP